MFSRRATCWRFLPEFSMSRNAKTTAASAAVFPQISISPTNDVPPHPRVVASRKAFDEARQFALGGGGEKGNAKHVHVNKKVLPRERISRILDECAPFLELSQQAGLGMDYGDIPNACVIAGVGPVHGQLCMIIANDATVKGGTIFPISLKKQLRAQQIALENCLPCIYVIDSGGAFLPLQSEIFNPGGRAFYNQAIMSAKGIPQLAMVCGSCTAGGAYIPTMADESVIVRGIGHVFLGGPPLVKAALGEDVTAEELGGADLHCKISGCTDHLADTEEEAFSCIRSIVASLNLELPHPPPRNSQPPLSTSSSDVIDFNSLVASLVDDGRFSEFKSSYGDGVLQTRAGFAHIDGRLVGVLGFLGPIGVQDGIKGSHFIQLCSQRDVPLVVFQNCHVSSEATSQDASQLGAEAAAAATATAVASFEVTPLMRSHAQLMTSFACAGSPIVTIVIGPNDHLSAFAAAPPAAGPRFSFAWPMADPPLPGMLDPDLMLQLAISGHPDITEEKKQKLQQRLQREQTALHAASRCWIDGVFLPEDTRTVLTQCLQIFEQAKVNKPLFEKREKITLTNLKF